MQNNFEVVKNGKEEVGGGGLLSKVLPIQKREGGGESFSHTEEGTLQVLR